ncbi:AAA family ATPase [Pseudomonas danubii]|uniref:AAA family ATPase n=1 Tax=Pseudomonas danubii TaxID=2497146 RepID=UPI0038577B41
MNRTQKITDYLKARYAILVIESFEEERVIAELSEIAKSLNHRIFLWNSTLGIQTNGAVVGDKTFDLKLALDFCEEKAREENSKNIFVFCDAHNYLTTSCNAIYRRRLKDLAINIRSHGYRSNCIIVAPNFEIANDLQKEVTLIDFPLPSRDEVKTQIENFSNAWKDNNNVKINLPLDSKEKLIDAALGLTSLEIDNSLSRSLVSNLKLDEHTFKDLLAEKKQIIRKTGILEYIDSQLNLDDVGGLATLKKWLHLRSQCFGQAAKEFGVGTPKGLLLTGVPGCGKSLTAKCVASSWNMPLLRLDMGKIFQGIVGSSESNIRSALQTAEAISPCILWIDEIEKGLSGSSSGASDGGTATRVFGTLLTWMQEKTAPVFVFATANNLSSLPPELLRKGRFDEIFFVDFPSAVERRKILEIHLRKLKRDPGKFDLDRLVDLGGEANFGKDIVLSGAELEAWVGDALIEAFSRRMTGSDDPDDLAMSDFEATISRMVPMSKVRKDEFAILREWANQNAISASAMTVNEDGAERQMGGRRIDF